MLAAVRLPARDAIIPPDKLREYLLSVAHPDGRGTIWIVLTGETAPRLVTLISAEMP